MASPLAPPRWHPARPRPFHECHASKEQCVVWVSQPPQCITVHHSAAYRSSLHPFATCWLSCQTLSEQTKQQVSNANAKNSAIKSAKEVRTDVYKALVISALCAQRTQSRLNACWLTPAKDLQAWKSCKQCHCVSLSTISSSQQYMVWPPTLPWQYSLFFYQNLRVLRHKLGTPQDISSGHSCVTLQRRYGWATQPGTRRHWAWLAELEFGRSAAEYPPKGARFWALFHIQTHWQKFARHHMHGDKSIAWETNKTLDARKHGESNPTDVAALLQFTLSWYSIQKCHCIHCMGKFRNPYIDPFDSFCSLPRSFTHCPHLWFFINGSPRDLKTITADLETITADLETMIWKLWGQIWKLGVAASETMIDLETMRSDLETVATTPEISAA